MTLFWSLAALLALELAAAAAQPLFRWERVVGSCSSLCGSTGIRESLVRCRGPSGDTVDDIICDPFTKPSYKPGPEPCNRVSCFWSIIVGSCTHTCGPFGVKPSLIVCFSQWGIVDEIKCDKNMKPPQPLPEPCNRIPCPAKPVFTKPDTLIQPDYLCEDLDIFLGQNAFVREGYRLVIAAQLYQRLSVTPAPTFVWTLPSRATLGAGESSGNAGVNGAGTRLTVSDIALGDVGSYSATATNSIGSDTLSSTITVQRYSWDVVTSPCSHTCGLIGIRLVLVLCKDDLSGGVVDTAYCCVDEQPANPLKEPCNRIPCPKGPEFDQPSPLLQVRPIPCEDLGVLLGQDATMKEGQRFVIVARLKPGAAPDPSFVWTLPSGETLDAGGRSGNVRVNARGTGLTVASATIGNAGSYSATAGNSEGSVTLSSTISMSRYSWNISIGLCTHTCGPQGIKPALALCRNDSSSVDEINCCTDRPTTPPPEPCNRIPCPEPPQIKVPPSFVQNPPIRVGNIAIGAGQNVQIHSGNSLRIETNLAKPGIPPATFSWSLPGGETVNSGEMSGQFQVHENGTLAITNIEWNNRGDYGVRASNGAGSDSITSSVTVLIGPTFFDPPRLTTIDIEIGQNVTITEGYRLVIRARVVQGAPDPVVLWTLPDGSTPKDRLGRFSVAKSGELVVKNITLADRGRYTATATNSVGEITAVSRVIVVRK